MSSTVVAPPRGSGPVAAPGRPRGRRSLVASPGAWLVWGAVAIFLVLLLGVVSSVLVNSFGTRWFDTWLPAGYTTRWYTLAWDEFGLPAILLVTVQVVGAVVGLSG